MEKSLIENLLEEATRRSYQKVPIRWLQGDPCVPLEPFLCMQMRSS